MKRLALCQILLPLLLSLLAQSAGGSPADTDEPARGSASTLTGGSAAADTESEFRTRAAALHKLYPQYNNEDVIAADEQLAICLFDKQEHEQADQLFVAAIAARKTLPSSTYNTERMCWMIAKHCRWLLSQHKNDLAIQGLRDAERMEKDLPDGSIAQLLGVQRELAYVYACSHHAKEAEPLEREIIHTDKVNHNAEGSPEYIHDLEVLAWTCAALDKNNEAIDLYERAHQLRLKFDLNVDNSDLHAIAQIKSKPAVIARRLFNGISRDRLLCGAVTIVLGLGLAFIACRIIFHIGKR